MEINPAASRMTIVAALVPAPVVQGEARHLAYGGGASARVGAWSGSCVLGRTVALSTDTRLVVTP